MGKPLGEPLCHRHRRSRCREQPSGGIQKAPFEKPF